MAVPDISAEINAFRNAAYGEDVRAALIQLAQKLRGVITSELANMSETWNAYKDDMDDAWSAYQSSMNSAWSAYQSSMNSAWGSYQNSINGAWDSYKNSVDDTLAKFDLWSFNDTLTASDDLNTVTKPGVYYYNNTSRPANAPSISGHARLLVLKSTTGTNYGAEWQLVSISDLLLYRLHAQSSSGAWGDWQTVTRQSDLLELSNNSILFVGTLTSSDDLDTIGKPGIYFYNQASLPSHTPNNLSGRILIVKSTTGTNKYAEWQMVINNVDNKPSILYFRSQYNNGVFSDWQYLDANMINNWISTVDSNGLIYRKELSNSDDLNNLTQLGVYYYSNNSSRPNNSAPINKPTRLLDIKSATQSNHSYEFQLTVNDGVLYYRNRNSAADDWLDWNSVNDTGSPVYQNETLPYNATLYHAKWDSLITQYVLRRITLGNVDNDVNLPIYAYEFSPQRDFVGLTASGSGSTPVRFDWSNALYERPKILIIGGVHGNEKCTPMDIYTIAKRLLSRNYNDIACKFDWYFIPLVNPWGYSHARLDSNGNIIYDNGGTTAEIVECSETINAGIRNNENNQNINRDWSDVVYTSGGVLYGFQTKELQIIKDYVLNLSPQVFIDAHQNHVDQSGIDYPIECHAGAAIDSDNTDPDYIKRMQKIYRYIDIANADTDKTMLRYRSNTRNVFQSCRIWPTIRASTSEHYFSGVTALNGSTIIGNTQHRNICTDFSICSETSEITYTYSGTTEWYNPVACTFSCTYLWNIIKQISKMF